MGGKALSVPTRRITKDEFLVISQKIHHFLETIGVSYRTVPFYREKESFGDFDIVVADNVRHMGHSAQESPFEPLKNLLSGTFHSRSFFVNSNVLSFEFRNSPYDEEGFQVDFITFPASEMDMAADYFSYNDLGNLIGRVAHKMGLSYGQKGLLYPIREGNHLIATPVVTGDADNALRFLGYDSARFRRGFDSLEDIFDFAASTPYFSSDIYLLENRNAIARKRDNVRPNYRGFLNYLKDHPRQSYDYPEKDFWLPRLFEAYPSFEKDYRDAKQVALVRKNIKEIFNGNLVSSITGLTGRELGTFMQEYRSGFNNDEDFLKYLQSTDVERDIRQKRGTKKSLSGI